MCLKEVAEEAPDDPSDEDFVGVEVVVTEGLCKDLIKSSNRSSASSGKKRKFFMSQIQYSLLSFFKFGGKIQISYLSWTVDYLCLELMKLVQWAPQV